MSSTPSRPRGGPHDLRLVRPRRLTIALLGVGDVLGAGLTAVLTAPGVDISLLALPHAAPVVADVVIVDLVAASALAGTQTFRLTRSARRQAVLGLSPDGRPDLLRQSLARGVDGVVSASWSAIEVRSTVRAAAEGRFVRPAAFTDRLVRGDDDRHPDGTDLTTREVEVLCRVAAGMSNSEIALDLFVSINTVKTYVRSCYRRVGVQTRSEAIVWFYRHGLGDCAVAAPAVTAAPVDPDEEGLEVAVDDVGRDEKQES